MRDFTRWLAVLALTEAGEATRVVRGAGSTFVGKFYQDAALVFATLTDMRFEVDYTEMALSSGLCRIQDWAGACGAGDDSEPRLIDWMGSDQPLSPGDYAAYPDLQMYPTGASAVVPVYNLPSITSADPALVLAPDVLADIFRTAITQWDDPRIAAANPVLAAAGKLPAQSITVIVREDSAGSTAVLKRALGQFDPAGFGAQIAESPLPTWAGATVVPCASGIAGTAPCVRSTAYSIGYTGLTEVRALSLSPVSILKPGAEVAVAADVKSVESALVELGSSYGSNGDDPDHLTFALTNGESLSAWPISAVSYIAMRTNHSHFAGDEACERRRDTVLFWRWFFTSQYASAHALTIGFVPLPAAQRQRIYERLQAEMLCDGQPAFQPVAVAPVLYPGGPGWLSRPIMRYKDIANAPFANMASATALASVGEAGLDVAFGHFARLHVSAELVSIPYAGVSLAVAFSLCAGVAGCGLADQTLNLDIAAVAAVLNGNLTRWLDLRLVALNPWLAEEPYTTDIGASREIVLVGTAADSATNQAVLSNLQWYRGGASLDALLPGGRSLVESDDARVVAALATTRWSMGVVAYVNDDWKDAVSFAALHSPHNGKVAIPPSLAGLASCTIGEEEAALAGLHGWDLWASVAHDCYPLTATVTAVMPRNYHGDSCLRGGQTVRFVQWVLGDMAEGLLRNHMLPLAPMAPQLVTEQLYEVCCDGKSWLDSRINRGHLGWALRLFVVLTAVILAVILLAICAIFFAWRHAETVKSAQPLFLGITACGLIITLTSGVLSTLDHEGAAMDDAVPVGQPGRYPLLDTSCRAQVWLYFIGSSMSVGALVAKLWRVTVVMINPTMRDIRIQASSLLKYICASLLFDVAVLMPWTVVSPPFYRIKVFDTGADEIESWHGSCDVVPSGAEPYVVVLLAKAILIVLFGIYLCGRSRGIRSLYSEGTAMMFVLTSYLQTTVVSIIIGWAIYPFTEWGSPVGFLLIKWFMPLTHCTTICIFIFGARLIFLWEEEHTMKKNAILSVIKPAAMRRSSVAHSSLSGRMSCKVRPTGRAASVIVTPFEHGDGSLHSETASQLTSQTASHPASRLPSCKPCELQHSGDQAEEAGPGGHHHHRGKSVMPRPATQIDKNQAALQAAFIELQERLQGAEDELADARDDITELRERNNNLVNQLGDVRAQRDAIFFNTIMESESN